MKSLEDASKTTFCVFIAALKRVKDRGQQLTLLVRNQHERRRVHLQAKFVLLGANEWKKERLKQTPILMVAE